MHNSKYIIFIWTQTYREIFKSTLLYLYVLNWKKLRVVACRIRTLAGNPVYNIIPTYTVITMVCQYWNPNEDCQENNAILF